MENLRNSDTLKIISYILIPFLVLSIILGAIYIEYNSYNKEDLSRGDYYKTDSFVYNEYYPNLQRIFRICENINEGIRQQGEYYNSFVDNYTLVQETPTKIYYSQTYRGYYNGFKYIIVDEKGTIFTNIKVENYNEKIEQIKNSEYYWYKETSNINTNLEQLNDTGFAYNFGLENLKDVKNNKFSIYTTFDKEQSSILEYKVNVSIYNFVANVGSMPVYAMSYSILILFIIGIYLIWSIGHKKNKEGIYLSNFDKFSYEIIFAVGLIVIVTFLLIGKECLSNANIYTLVIGLIAYLICYISCAVIGITTIKRIKARNFIRTTLTYKICKWIKEKINEITNLVLWNKEITTKLIIYYMGFLIISAFLVITITIIGFFGILLLLIFWSLALYVILNYCKQLNNIKQQLKSIYEGKQDTKIDTTNLEKNLKEMGEYVNSLSTGLTKAVEESLKSERMKTQLITNVSHDIKTPLTSIINYVDLLKKEEMPNEKAKEYLEILDNKSQRLKRLTEDLVEASKATSGNIKLNIESINLKELIKQISGEFEDKFKEKNLELILQMPKERINIKADSRYLYRVIENMYTNIIKYALEGSRVYIDIIKKENKVQIELKNISKAKLNINAEELMQRFVRGDTSRNTEGSGLGLSIAESLTKLQGGNFSIHLDGDLFKVVIEFML
ncbi:MAG: hypothetical protein HFJ41_01140 [Clostridia bacterium]|nr:hypothetical protein [Clostridia bacterium]